MQQHHWPSSSRPVNIPGAVPRAHKEHVSRYNDDVIHSTSRTRRHSHHNTPNSHSEQGGFLGTRQHRQSESAGGGANMSFVVPVSQSFNYDSTLSPRSTRHTASSAHSSSDFIFCAYCTTTLPARELQRHYQHCPALKSSSATVTPPLVSSPPLASSSYANGRYPYPYPHSTSAPSYASGASSLRLGPMSPSSPSSSSTGYYHSPSGRSRHVSLEEHGWQPSPPHTTAATSPSHPRSVPLPEVPEAYAVSAYTFPASGSAYPFSSSGASRPGGRRYYSDYPSSASASTAASRPMVVPVSQSLSENDVVAQKAILLRGRSRQRRSSFAHPPPASGSD